MGKLSNMIYMIDLLNTGNIYTIKELAEKLGVTERMIRYYKNEICSNGIAIESFKGPNGGYFMIDKIKNYTSINKYDIQLLENISNQWIQNNPQFAESKKGKLRDKDLKGFVNTFIFNPCNDIMNTILIRDFITPYPWYFGFIVSFIVLPTYINNSYFFSKIGISTIT